MTILRYWIPILTILVVVSTIPFVLSYETSTGAMNQPLEDFTVPSWIKNNAGWWADNLIDDNSFVSGIQWLISNDVILLPPTEQGVGDSENIIPRWIKTTAGWWADDQIHDITFVAAIKYLINEGIMVVMEPTVEETKCNFKGIQVTCPDVKEVEEIKEFHVVVNGHSCSMCKAWGYTGEKYYFQIDTFDEYRGDSLDGVTINAKIISKDGELRHNFGVLTTEDGIYNGYVTIPGVEWFGDNIFSVTGEYNGIEKTVEKEFEVFMKKLGSVGTLHSRFLYPNNSTSDGNGSFTELDGAHSVDTFTIGERLYAIVTAQADSGVQIIELTGVAFDFNQGTILPGIIATSVMEDGGAKMLAGARNVATYLIDADTASALSLTSQHYAIVAGLGDNGLQIIDIGIPDTLVARDSEVDDANDFSEIAGAYGVATFTIPSNSTYRGAIVTSNTAGSLTSVDITNPKAIVEKDTETDGGDFPVLGGVRNVATFTIDNKPYAIYVSQSDDGVQIVDLTVPTNIQAKDSAKDSEGGFTELEGAHGVAVWNATSTTGASDFGRSINTYAIVASVQDSGVQIINITDPDDIVPLDAETDGSNGFTELGGAAGVDTFTCGNLTYAIVASNTDDGIQLIDISDPIDIVAINAKTDGEDGFDELEGARNVVTFESYGNIYAIVTAQDDDGVQIVEASCIRD